jgi:uncharacterized protein (DUF2141 family)
VLVSEEASRKTCRSLTETRLVNQQPRFRPVVLAVILLLNLAKLGIPAAFPKTCTLDVHVDGFRNSKGLIGGAVFKDKAGWPENDAQAFARAAIPVPGKMQAVLTFRDVPEGRYGIVVLHDENANHRLDRNILRVPREGFGFANNPHVKLSAPSWQDASVQVACPATEIRIHLIYK